MKFKTYKMNKKKYLENDFALILDNTLKDKHFLCYFLGHISSLKTLVLSLKESFNDDSELVDFAMRHHNNWASEQKDHQGVCDTDTRESVCYYIIMDLLDYDLIYDEKDDDNCLGFQHKITKKWLGN
jgi:hypothetical protein